MDHDHRFLAQKEPRVKQHFERLDVGALFSPDILLGKKMISPIERDQTYDFVNIWPARLCLLKLYCCGTKEGI